MRLAPWCCALLVAAAGGLSGQNSAPTQLGALRRSVSSSGQFVIYHSDNTVRSRVARKAEDLKTEWRRLLTVDDNWKWPVVIQLLTARPAGAPRLRTSFFEGDANEYKLQIDVFDPTVIQGGDFDQEIFKALFLEYAYREFPPKAGKAFVTPPAWLIEAMYEDVRVRDEGIVAGLYEKLVQDGPPPKLEAFLKEKPEMMDATSRAVYRAKAMTLLRALLRLPGGPASLAAWLASLHEGNPNDADRLLKHFPGLAEKPAELSKMWALCIADASASNRAKPLGLADTQKQLNLIFELVAPKDPKKPEAGNLVGPLALPALVRMDSGKFLAGQKAEDLLRLEVRAHPVMRPVVEEYRIIASELSRKPKKNFDKRLQKNLDLQNAIAQRMDEIDDYMNWFEATKLETSSQKFESTFDVREKSSVMRRNDAITRELDAAEQRLR